MTCKSTNVEARNDLSTPSGIRRGADKTAAVHYTPRVEHAGEITHVCIFPEKDHPADGNGVAICQCRCGHRWVRNYK